MSAALAALVALLVAAPAGAKGTSMEHEYFWFTSDLQEGYLSASFLRSGRAVAGVTGKVGTRQEIGDYETMLPADTVDRLRKLKAQVGFDALPPSGSGQPGMKGVSIGESRGPEGPEPKGWWLFEIPPAVQPLLDEVRRLSEEVMKHPVRVLRGRGAARKPSFPANAPATFEVTLEGLGTKALRARNPLSIQDPNYTGLRLVVTGEGAPGQPGNELWLDLTPQHVLPLPGAAPDRGAVLELKPGEKRTFLVARALLAAPGRYRAVLLYRSTPPRGDEDFLDGTLRIDLGAFELVAAKP